MYGSWTWAFAPEESLQAELHEQCVIASVSNSSAIPEHCLNVAFSGKSSEPICHYMSVFCHHWHSS